MENGSGTWIQWIIGTSIAAVAAAVALLSYCGTTKKPCGVTQFAGKGVYQQISSHIPVVSSEKLDIDETKLYNSAKEPRDAGEILIEQTPRLSDLTKALRDGKAYSRGKMIFVYGGGGSGKSAILSQLQLSPHTVFLDLGKVYKANEQTGVLHPDTELRDELKIDSQVISQMPALKEYVLAGGLEGLFRQALKISSLNSYRNIILDSIDEIHPASSVRVMDLAMSYLNSHPDKNIVIAGRGESFRSYFEKEGYSQANFEGIRVRPIFVGDEPLLTWYVWQYLRYNHKRNHAAGPLPNRDQANQLVNQLKATWAKKPDLKQFMLTLAPADFMMSHIQDGYDLPKLMNLLFNRIIERNRGEHYRPMQSDAKGWNLYLAALIQSARVAELRPDGTFVFPVEQTVMVAMDDRCVPVLAPKVLNLSELVDLEPFDRDHLIYTFFPVTLHQYLAEQAPN